MCTVLIGRDVTGRGEIVIGANRDENPARPSDPPGVLLDSPRLVGGRDRVSGGTWLAVNTEGAERSVTLLLNRRPLPGAPVPARSRGLLTIDVARARDPLATAQEEAASGRYGPCTLVHVSPAACWWLAIPSASPARAGTIAHGWHAITHAEMDDSSEPRTVWLGRELARDTLMGTGLALAKFASLLAHHGDASSPAVCLHEGVMRTVSSALIVLRSGQPGQLHDIYRHVEGRPCTQPFVDVSHLLGTPARNDEAP
jgi:uncharacterized protein with NRDE domain